MAGIGLRKPHYAIYNYAEETGAVTYSGGGLLAKAVEFSASIESGDDNNLYALQNPTAAFPTALSASRQTI